MTHDMHTCQAFYGTVFGWQIQPFDADATVVLCRLPGYVGGEPQQPVTRDVVAVMVDARQQANVPSRRRMRPPALCGRTSSTHRVRHSLSAS